MFRRSGLVVLALAAGWRPAYAQRIAEVQMAPPFLRMVPDAQTQVTATAYDTAGMPINVRFRWSSSNINVAVVSENGVVRAIAPGATLISAWTDSDRGRRRGGQLTVRVIPPLQPGFTAPGAPGATVGPPPGAMPAPAVPATPPPGGVTVAPTAPPGPMVYVTPRFVDSAMKASINCAEPMLNAVNPLNACYDERPRITTGSEALPLPEACTNGASRVLMLVRVNETGAVTEVMPFSPSSCPQFTEAALAAARAFTYTPARTTGKPVSAWVRLMLHPPGPPKQ